MATKKSVYISAEQMNKFVKPRFITGKKHYLYAHYRLDKEEPFYFGVGTLNKKRYDRALCRTKRNIIWKRIAAKSKYNVLIIDESDIEEEILDKEIFYVALMGRKSDSSGCLSNLTKGGEGASGYKIIWTEEMRKKASESAKKRKASVSTKEKLREIIRTRSFFGKKNYTKPVYQIDDSGKIVKEHESVREAARCMGVAPQSISSACKKNSNSKGYKWRYKNAS